MKWQLHGDTESPEIMAIAYAIRNAAITTEEPQAVYLARNWSLYAYPAGGAMADSLDQRGAISIGIYDGRGGARSIFEDIAHAHLELSKECERHGIKSAAARERRR